MPDLLLKFSEPEDLAVNSWSHQIQLNYISKNSKNIITGNIKKCRHLLKKLDILNKFNNINESISRVNSYFIK